MAVKSSPSPPPLHCLSLLVLSFSPYQTIHMLTRLEALTRGQIAIVLVLNLKQFNETHKHSSPLRNSKSKKKTKHYTYTINFSFSSPPAPLPLTKSTVSIVPFSTPTQRGQGDMEPIKRDITRSKQMQPSAFQSSMALTPNSSCRPSHIPVQSRSDDPPWESDGDFPVPFRFFSISSFVSC